MAVNKTTSILLFAIFFSAINFIRWEFVPRQYFFEGDDAAISTGVARLCSITDIGPYFMHPPWLSEYDVQVFQQANRQAEEPASSDKSTQPRIYPFYRYGSMTGVYFLGTLACSWKSPAVRLLVLCFIAGTFFPLFLSLFLFRLFRPLPPFAFPFIYLLIALSPEVWISGTYYINDKILAVCFLSFALCMITFIKKHSQVGNLFLLVLTGFAFGLAMLMRLDSILFLPVIIAIILVQIPNLSLKKRILESYKTGLFLFSSVVVYYIVMKVMGASVINGFNSALVEGPHISLADAQQKFRVVLSAFGWAQIAIVGAIITLVGIHQIRRRSFAGDLRECNRIALFKDLSGSVSSILPIKPLILSILLLAVEFAFLFSYPYVSPKYILFSSALFSGLCAVILIKLWWYQVEGSSFLLLKKSAIPVLMTFAYILIISSGFIQLERISTDDGDRYIGGWFVQKNQPAPDSITARKLFSCLMNYPNGIKNNILVKTTSWILEETISYEAAQRGWQNRIIPLPVSVGHPAKYPSLNEYIIPGTRSTGIFVTADWDTVVYGGELTRSVFEKALGPDYISYQDLNCGL